MNSNKITKIINNELMNNNITFYDIVCSYRIFVRRGMQNCTIISFKCTDNDYYKKMFVNIF